MINPTTGTTTDPEREYYDSPRRSNPIAAIGALVLIAAVIGAIVWTAPSDDTTRTTVTTPVETTVSSELGGEQ